MKVSKLSEVPRQSMSRATKFFHGAEHVSRQGLTDESKEVSVNIIHFDHGAHTRMHIHGCDQVLLVTEGKGFVETEQERHELAEGDVVFAPAARSTATAPWTAKTSRTSRLPAPIRERSSSTISQIAARGAIRYQ
jgi:quercetin dioxygenase-like cupin family protein